MPFHKTFGIDLGTSTVKIYSQEQDTMITEKNMIAIRNQNQVLAVGNEAYGMYEKNPSNVSVISPMAFGKIADVTHTEMVLQALLEKTRAEDKGSIHMPFHKTFGIDLGTSTVKIYSQEQDTMITEKNMIAIRNQNQVLAVGNEAYGMYEKNPSNVSVISPMAFGKIADVTHTEMVLQALLEKSSAGGKFGNTLYLAVPSDLSEIEQRAYYTIGNSNRKNKIYMVNKTIADAVALGIPITHTKGSMIVNIGAQSTEISVIEGGKVVLSKIVELGGKQLNEAIVNEVRKQYNLHIGNRTARRLKFSLAYLKEDIREARKVVGIDSLSGLPREGIIPSDMIYATILPVIQRICEEIQFFLERTPPQMMHNITDQGIFLAGGTTRIPDMDWFISQATGQRVRLSSYYELCTICGLKEIIGNKTLQKWVK